MYACLQHIQRATPRAQPSGYQYQCSKVNVISLAKIQPSALRAKEVRLYLHWYGTSTAHCVSIVCVLQNAQLVFCLLRVYSK